MNALARYLTLENLTVEEFSVRIGCATRTVRRYLAGRLPDPPMIRRIYEATGAQVCPNDLYDLHPPRAPRVNGISIAGRIRRLFGLEPRA